MLNQFQLRSSLRSPPNFMNSVSTNSTNSSNNLYTNLNSSQNMNQNGGMTSPKINKSFDMSDF
jgi:hypothetical protein